MTHAFGTPGAAVAPGAACPCGSGATYAGCCRVFHDGRPAPTAEALMRSRYSAFAVGDAQHLLRTWHPRTRPEGLTLDPGHRWIGLEVLGTQDGLDGDETGVVVYRATSLDASGARHEMTETSRFARRGGRWVYVDGDVS
ncbi:YchJ family protein [Mobilicoccus massiliensis]|uniref:YchJ family protein n=1 Tax=Mobilicoccus massiliensis TaxID=1522310 RepID=UPI000694096C|nr:YchJ family metal-binding protein [Mobilicoccus massiliensis]